MLKTIKVLLMSAILGLSTTVLAVVDINTANQEELQTLKGIGAKKAADIIAYREAHGGFKSVEELLNVKGVGKATLEKLRTEIAVEGDKSAVAAKSTSVVSDGKTIGAEEKTNESGEAVIPEKVRKSKADKATNNKVVDGVKKSETKVTNKAKEKAAKTKNNAEEGSKEN
jgi:competence protein comEA helix-hairpin-helix repeat region